MVDATNVLKPVWFMNDGEMEPLFLVTMGANVKTKDSPIGYFGTGLKFAIAAILRMGGRIEIYIGLKLYKIELRKTNMRGHDFDLIYVDGERAGYTTQLGRDWLPWMAYRELHSNALDESGCQIDHGTPPKPEEGKTLILVWENKIQEEFYLRDKTFLQSEPLEVTANLEIHPGENERSLYYRGVKVGEFDKPTKFRYNILNGLTLTEDRTVAGVWLAGATVTSEIRKCKNSEILTQVLTAEKKYFEHGMHHGDMMIDKSPEYLDAARKIIKDPMIDKRALPTGTVSFLEKMRREDVETATIIDPDDLMQSMLADALAKLSATGLPLKDFPIVVVETLGAGVMGLAKNGTAYLARAVFQNGQRYLEATLLEELFHLTTGFKDYSRDMQDWLINEILATHDRALGQDPVYKSDPAAPDAKASEDEIPF